VSKGRGDSMASGAGMAVVMLIASACPAFVLAACPDDAERAALRERAEHAIAAGASTDVAWGQIRDQVRSCGEVEAEARVLSDWADALRRHGNNDQVLAIEQARLTLAERHGLLRQEAEARLNVALIYVARGEIEPAAVQMDLALDRVRRLDDIAGQARVMTELSRLERRRGDYLAALRYELTGLDLRRRLDPPPELWRSLLNLAVLYEQIELFDEARRHYAMALAEAEREGVPENIGDALNGYSGFLNDFGGDAAPQALRMAQRALEIHRGLGDSARIGSCLLQVGRAHVALGELDAAETVLDEAFALATQGGFEALRAHVEFRWGELEFQRGHLDSALQRIERARSEYERQSNRHRLIKVYGVLERLHTAMGDELAAAHAGREHFRLRNELLGANATGKLGELLTNFALADAEHRNQRLTQENAINAVRLDSERRLRYAGYLIAIIIVAGLLLLALRHAAVRRLNRLLTEQTRETEAQRAALADANAQLIRINRIDALTGLASRAHGLEHLAAVLGSARGCGNAPALILFDLDHFKDINDRYGHLAGDQVLCAVAATLRDLAPDDALAARVGGEELMLVLENAQLGRAEMLADAIRRRVRDLAIDVGPQRVQVTMSAGIAHVSAAATESLRELYAAADQALYAAKHAGRDCVRTHGLQG
jgi:diguanylate cyclase (GGDEF)-like protein